MTSLNFDNRLAQGKTEILQDIATGRVPAQLHDFDQLNSYVDANEYGGLTEDGFAESFDSREEWLQFCSLLQASLDSWIRNGLIA